MLTFAIHQHFTRHLPKRFSVLLALVLPLSFGAVPFPLVSCRFTAFLREMFVSPDFLIVAVYIFLVGLVSVTWVSFDFFSAERPAA